LNEGLATISGRTRLKCCSQSPASEHCSTKIPCWRARLRTAFPTRSGKIELLKRHRAGDTEERVVQAIHLTINGIAADCATATSLVSFRGWLALRPLIGSDPRASTECEFPQLYSNSIEYFPHTARRRWHIDVAQPNTRVESVDDSIDDRRRCADGAGLTGALDAQWVGRRRHVMG